MASDVLQFKLPGIGEGVESADVAEILVEVGDTVEAEQILMELETEKAVVELPAPQAGTISAIHIAAGDSIEIGQHILDIGGAGGGTGSDEGAAPASKEQPKPPQAEKIAESAGSDQPKNTSDQPAGEKAEPANESSGRQATSTSGGGDSYEFRLPAIGEGVESADIAEVAVSEGDSVSEGDIILELETEKAVVEVPIDRSGTIEKLLVAEGDTIEVDQPLLMLAGSGAGSGGSEEPADPNLGAAQPAAAEEAGRDVETDHERRVPGVSRAMGDSGATENVPAVSGGNRLPSSGGDAQSNHRADDENALPAPAAPSTRRLARQLGVNLRSVKGSGPGGRITRDDVQAHVKDQLTNPQRSANLPATQGQPSGGQVALAPPPLPDFSAFGQTEREKMGKLSRTAAENLTTAWHVIPHVTQQDLADITDIEAARKSFAKGAGQNGPKVTMTAIAMKTLATCLQAFPKFNSSLDPETFELVYKRYYHIGCAVDTPSGLLVPVIRDCDEKSILEIAAELTELAGKARDRKLSPDSMRGATCTVTNLGGIGGTGFTPIVNYPEVAILGMSRGEKRLQLQEGQVVERMLLPLSLSYDHRVINGADAAKFLVMFKNLLQDPFSLLAAV